MGKGEQGSRDNQRQPEERRHMLLAIFHMERLLADPGHGQQPANRCKAHAKEHRHWHARIPDALQALGG
ncbi:hypothetical protein D3C78_1928890 [compost metagenome]